MRLTLSPNGKTMSWDCFGTILTLTLSVVFIYERRLKGSTENLYSLRCRQQELEPCCEAFNLLT